MLIQPDYTWIEGDSFIQVQVPLKGQKASSVDIFATELLLKVSFPPYILVLDLFAEVDETKSKAIAKGGALSIKVQKKRSGIWGKLVAEGSKQELKQRREASIKAHREKETELHKTVQDKKREEERQATRDQMAVDAHVRQRLEDLKAEEKRVEEEALYEAMSVLQAQSQENNPEGKAGSSSKNENAAVQVQTTVQSNHTYEQNRPQKIIGNELTTVKPSPYNGHKGIFSDADIEEMLNSDEELDSNKHQDPTDEIDEEFTAPDDDLRREILDDNIESYIPEPRQQEKFPMTFTPRLFPTPARESKAREEEDWIIRNRTALKKNKDNYNKLPKHLQDISETDAYWLKAKGDEFFKLKDYLSAVSAYTAGLEGDPEFVACLSNRAACYLKLGEFSKCILDCSAALDMLLTHRHMTAESKQNTRLKVFVRRGTAYCQMGIYDQALADYRAAASMEGSNAGLVTDLVRLQVLSDCYQLKKNGDALFAKGGMQEARQKYTEALLLEPGFVSCLSNRAACHLALNNLDLCIEDCTTALKLLDHEEALDKEKSSRNIIEELGSSIPLNPVGHKRAGWLLKTICRRAMCYLKQNNISKALDDYKKAQLIAPDDELIQQDVQRLESFLKEEVSDHLEQNL